MTFVDASSVDTSMTRPAFSLSQKALIALAVVILPILVVFLVSYRTGKKDLEKFILADLKLHAGERASDVLNFLEMHKRRAADFASDGFIRDGLEELIKGGRADRGRLAGYLRKNKLTLDKDFLRLILYFPDGKRAASTDGTGLLNPGFKVREAGSAAIIKTGFENGGPPEIVFAAPVRSRHNDAYVGVIATFLRLDGLDKALGGALSTDPGTLSRDAETFKSLAIYLVDREGFLLTKARFTDNAVLKRRIDNALVNGCVERQRADAGFYEDYRGVQVAGASMCIPSLGWTLLVEVDRDEALASILDIRRYAGVIAVITLTLLSVLSLLFSRFVLTDLRGLTRAARLVAGGNYDAVMPVRTNDEIGILSGAFNDMAREIKKRTEALEQTAVSLANAQRISHLGSWEWDPATGELRCSDEVYRILGVSPGELSLSHDCYISLVHPDDRDMVAQALDDATARGKEYSLDYRVIRPNGAQSVVHSQGEVVYGDNNRPILMRGTLHDITERVRLEEARTRLTAIIEATPDFVSTADPQGRMLYYNKAARKMLGLGDDDDISKVVIPDVHPEWAAKMVVEEGLVAATRDGSWSGETAFLSRDGREIPVSQVILAHKDAEGRVVFYSTIARDITERKRAEEEVKRLNAALEARVAARTFELKEANRELEAFSYSIAHDLRAPLRIIDGFSHALEEDLKDALDANARDHLRRVRKSSARMSQLIDDLLELSRITRMELRPDAINLSAVAGAVAAELKKTEPSRRVEFVIEHNLKAQGDARLLRVAIENLLGNAWKFTGMKEEARIEFGSFAARDGKRVYFVMDNGAGFDMRYLAKLFGAFQRLHAESEFQGTGIGLATVARIIKRHGGTIWAEGEVGRGAVFYFTL